VVQLVADVGCLNLYVNIRPAKIWDTPHRLAVGSQLRPPRPDCDSSTADTATLVGLFAVVEVILSDEVEPKFGHCLELVILVVPRIERVVSIVVVAQRPPVTVEFDTPGWLSFGLPASVVLPYSIHRKVRPKPILVEDQMQISLVRGTLNERVDRH